MTARLPILLITFALACDAAPPAAVVREKIRVTTTAYALANIVTTVGGDRVDADWLFELGDPPAPPELSDAERAKLQAGRLLVGSGPRNEPWLTRDLGEALQSTRLLSLEDLPITRTTPERGLLWLDPLVARDVAAALAGRLAQRFPEDRAAFEKNATDFRAALAGVLAKFPNASFAGLSVVIVGQDFDPFLDRFGVRRVRVEGRPWRLSDDDLSALRRTAAGTRATAILLPADTPPGARRRIETRTGLRVVLIDPLGASGGANRSTYLEQLEFNLASLRAAVPAASVH